MLLALRTCFDHLAVACRRKCLFALLLAVLQVGGQASSVAAAVSPAVAQSPANFLSKSKHSQPPQWVKNFPLWMNVPRKSFAVLAEDVTRQRRWGVYAYRGTAPRAGQKPCIEIATLYFGGTKKSASFSSSNACGPLAPPSVQPTVVQSGFSIQKSFNGPTMKDTEIGMILGPEVTKVKMQLGMGREQTRVTRYLSVQQAKKAHITQFRYLAFGVAHAVCLSFIKGFDAEDSEVLTDQLGPCD